MYKTPGGDVMTHKKITHLEMKMRILIRSDSFSGRKKRIVGRKLECRLL